MSAPELMAELAKVSDVAGAVRLLNHELERDGKSAFALLVFDARRNLVLGQGIEKLPDTQIAAPGGGQIALDHLPSSVRSTLVAGRKFADVGDQSAQYAKILDIQAPGNVHRLYMRGLCLDNALAGVLAAVDCRRRATAKLLERIEPLGALFQLVFARLHERDARFEAVNALHDISSRLRATHTATLREAEQEIERLRTARGDVIDLKRVEQLEAAASNAKRRAATAERNLAAVEQQVASAVERLERAHTQLHEQNDLLRASVETIRRLEAQLVALGVTPVVSSSTATPAAGVPAHKITPASPIAPTRA